MVSLFVVAFLKECSCGQESARELALSVVEERLRVVETAGTNPNSERDD